MTDLDPFFHDLTNTGPQGSLSAGFFTGGKDTMKLSDLVIALKQTYCGPIGAEYIHITSIEKKRRLQQHIESGHAAFNSEKRKRLLSELTVAEGLGRYLGAKFLGVKRFLLEGGDALIPMLKEMTRHAGNSSTREVILGMARRGRLNVLVNTLDKRPQEPFDEFAGKHKKHPGTGDVKCHMGSSSDIETGGGLVHLALVLDLSHLEIVNPVVTGSVRARLDRLDEPSSNKVLLITIHGDAAATGQGVVQKTLNMSKVRGYEVDDIVRIVINNQAGLTTSSPLDTHSTPYCIDIDKMVQASIFHVNADDPEAVAFVIHLALDFRNTSKRDIPIGLVCYRCHGHNEADEPSATQPLMYQKIKKHPIPRKICTDKLEADKIVTLEDATKMANLYRDTLDVGECVVKEWRSMNIHLFTWSPYLNHEWDENHLNRAETKRLQELAKCISTVPEAVEIQSHVAKIYGGRQAAAAGEKLFDWGGAENPVYATSVGEDTSVRLSGEDPDRGIFFHRHAVIHNQTNGSTYTPLQHVYNGQGTFRVRDPALSEEVVLVFEYGYATAEPRALTIWEAQLGDFINGAQVAIDQFTSSGEQRWGRMCGLVMLLPCDYEDQGPEHPFARLKCYLQLCVEQNMQVCVPSAPVQVYHMLCRQALWGIRRLLVVIPPKSLLRYLLVVSMLDELANDTFLPAIGEVDELDPRGVKRVAMCSDKICYDLLEQRRKNDQKDVAIMRTEQLYPFPHKVVQEALKPLAHAHDLVWCQEKSLNQGAWYCSQHHFYEVIPSGPALRYAGRPASVSPAVGYMSVHQKQQQDLINDALNVD